MKCRHCAAALSHVFLDLGSAPPSNAYLDADALRRAEPHYPLRLFVCDSCWLVQTEDHASADELFAGDYAYFSSTSRSWLAHAADYTRAISARLGLGGEHFVVEVASNDGYLLKNFVAAGIPCLGVEPTAGTAHAAEALGIPVLREFFGEEVARRIASERGQADLVIGNNVYAHVPDINDFTAGLREMLKPGGTITLEFPHLLELVRHCQFDTVYHEHFSYLSLGAAQRIFDAAGLRVFDVEKLPTHGGSLRVYGARAGDPRPASPAVAAVLGEEDDAGLRTLVPYSGFQRRAERVKDEFVAFLIEQKRRGVTVAGYGAAAKGNTLINFAGVRPDLLPYVCDAAPSKQGKYLPGSRIPILAPTALEERRPDLVVILPWNIAEEVLAQFAHLRESGARFAVAVPEMRLL
jgi:SAM-dependent methyltransferase